MPANAATVTIPGVELVRAGTWSAASGPVHITTEDFQSMLAAAQDPEIDHAALKIGHVDPRFDGEPSLGWITKLRVVGDKLVGDLVDVPAKLAEILPKAFRRRSGEILWGVRTPSGKKYRAVLSGLALLGVAPPAVKGLADVLSLYSAQGLESESESKVLLAEGIDDNDRLQALEAHRESVSRLLELGIATETQAAAMLADADAAAGITDASITTEPTAVGQNDDVDNDRNQGGTPMAVDDARIRELLGIEETADIEAAITDLATRAANTPPTGDGENGADNGGDNGTQTGGQGAPPANQPATPPADPAAQPQGELVTLSAGNLAALQAQAQEGAEAMRIVRTQQIEGVLSTALSEGRIAPADRDAFVTRLETDFEGTKTLLSNLTPRFATSELGGAGNDLGAVDDATWDKFQAETFPELAPSEEGK